MASEDVEPFSRPSGDIVLRSSDGVDHRVHKVILSEASPFFDAMFSLPQTQPTTPEPLADTSDSESSLIPVTEDSRTLNHLLRLCYPSPAPPPTSLSLNEIEQVLVAAGKYDIEVARSFCTMALEQFIKTEPIGAYGLALRLRLEKEARAAALQTLRNDFPPDGHGSAASVPDAIVRMSGADVYRLIQYRESCKSVALRQVTHELTVLKPPRNGVMVYICSKCSNQEPGATSRYLPFKLEAAKFRERAMRVLGARPCGAALIGDAEMNGLGLVLPLSLEKKCPFCTASILKVLNQLSEHLAKLVDEAVSAVEIKLDF